MAYKKLIFPLLVLMLTLACGTTGSDTSNEAANLQATENALQLTQIALDEQQSEPGQQAQANSDNSQAVATFAAPTQAPQPLHNASMTCAFFRSSSLRIAV